MKKIIYVDNAATTKLSKKILDSMMPFLTENYSNPSSLCQFSNKSKNAIEKARNQVALYLNADPKEIFFTASGSESNNWAIMGTALEMKKNGKNHIISSKIEHHSVLHTLNNLEKLGFDVTYVDVPKNGVISPNEIENNISEKTGLVTIMYANNEIGTIQPVDEIGRICRKYKILFHTDAVQAIGSIKIDVKKNIDMLSISAHKFHGPKGIGALYVRQGTKIQNLIHGGAQEKGRRAGTENVAGIVGLGNAIDIALENFEYKNQKIISMRDILIEECLKIEHSVLNGDPEKRLPGNVSMCFEGVEGESLLLKLDREGICASSGSACTSGSLDPSHVLLAIGRSHEVAHGSLRISLSEENSMDNIKQILDVLPKIISQLREMSPVWEKIKKEKI